jgi:hypothetical protein
MFLNLHASTVNNMSGTNCKGRKDTAQWPLLPLVLHSNKNYAKFPSSPVPKNKTVAKYTTLIAACLLTKPIKTIKIGLTMTVMKYFKKSLHPHMNHHPTPKICNDES